MPAKFTRKFKSGTFGVASSEDGAIHRWTITTANGRTRYSLNFYPEAELAYAAQGHYIDLCKERDEAGERVWMIHRVFSPKTLKERNIFLQATASS